MLTAAGIIAVRKAGHDVSNVNALITLAAASYGSLLPDIDDPRSWAGHHLILFALPYWIFRAVAKFLGWLFRSKAIKEYSDELGHRKILHYPTTYLVSFASAIIILKSTAYRNDAVPFWLLCLITGLMLLGPISHAIGDAFFGSIKLLAPFSNKSFSFTPFATGSIVEKLVLLILVIADIPLLMSIFRA